MTIPWAIIDANVNRAAEGLRVIEDYCRFSRHHPDWTFQLAALRHEIKQSAPHWEQQLQRRHTPHDVRAMAPHAPRPDVVALLRANFARAQEAVRVLEEWLGSDPYVRIRYGLYDLEQQIVLDATRPVVPRGVYVISDSPDVLVDAASRGAAMVQLRMKQATKGQVLVVAQSLRPRISHCPLIINDDLDIAVAIGADGVHTGQDGLPLSVMRRQLGWGRLMGRTTHSLAQGQEAVAQGADYVSVGPIWETPSKPGRPGIGFTYLEAAHTLGIPFVAIGGIGMDNVNAVLAHHPPLIGIIRGVDQLDHFLKVMHA